MEYKEFLIQEILSSKEVESQSFELDILDDILDLKLYENLQFQRDRGVENSFSIIIRTQ